MFISTFFMYRFSHIFIYLYARLSAFPPVCAVSYTRAAIRSLPFPQRFLYYFTLCGSSCTLRSVLASLGDWVYRPG
uniref:Putative secreted protein n=2 Tax=Anopheles triannulatus TaxID=58253 RepID=A0A2M4B5M9_9DIPT